MAGSDDPHVEELLEHLDALEETVDSTEGREAIRETRRAVRRLPGRGVFGRRISGYTGRDMAEAFVGSVIVGLPLLVEDGVYDIAEHFATTTVGPVPAFFLANVVFAISVVVGLLYCTDIQRVEVGDRLFGVVPKRLAGVLSISFLVAAVMMTMWGRVDPAEPWIALCRISVIWTGMAIGASLGDILPG
jgi:uncharacterized membrane protein